MNHHPGVRKKRDERLVTPSAIESPGTRQSKTLVNAFFHSQAKGIEFELEYSDSDLRMRVRDDGRGIEPRVLQSGRHGHFGLTGMRERAVRIDGVLEIFGNATGGTEVRLSVPGAIAFQTSSAE